MGTSTADGRSPLLLPLVAGKVAAQIFLSAVSSVLPFFALALNWTPGEFASQVMVWRHVGITLAVFCLGTYGIVHGPQVVIKWCLISNAVLIALLAPLAQHGLLLPIIALTSGLNSLALVNAQSLVNGEATRSQMTSNLKIVSAVVALIIPSMSLNIVLVIWDDGYWIVFMMSAVCHALAAWLITRIPVEQQQPAHDHVTMMETFRMYRKIAAYPGVMYRIMTVHLTNILSDPVAHTMFARYTLELSGTKQLFGHVNFASGLLAFPVLFWYKSLLKSGASSKRLYFGGRFLQAAVTILLGLTTSIPLTSLLFGAQLLLKTSCEVPQAMFLADAGVPQRDMPGMLSMAKVANCGLRIGTSYALGVCVDTIGTSTLYIWSGGLAAGLALMALQGGTVTKDKAL